MFFTKEIEIKNMMMRLNITLKSLMPPKNGQRIISLTSIMIIHLVEVIDDNISSKLYLKYWFKFMI
jgi:hypothetical protein